MKRFFIKHKKRILKFLLITAITIISFILAHKSATVERGYDALGGELFMFLIPFFVWVAPQLKETFCIKEKE